MDDNELQGLFAAFDDVTASDSLKSSTLDFIMSGAGAAPVAEAAEAAETARPAAAEAPAHAPAVTVTRGGKARIRNKWRSMRVAAVAACLALALTGGAAYAYPATTVKVTQGETTIELQVNLFGQVLSASANDDDVQGVIDQMGLRNTSYEESVMRVSHSLKESNPAMPVEVSLNGVPRDIDPIGEQLADERPAAQPEGSRDQSQASDGQQAESAEVPAEEQLASEPSAPSGASVTPSTPAGYEAPVVLPDPSGVTSSDDEPSTPSDDIRAPERTTPQPTKPTPAPDNGGQGGGDNGDTPDPAPAPAPETPETPAADDTPAAPQEEPAAEEPAEVVVPADEPEDEVTYSGTRPSRHYTQSTSQED